MGEPDILLPLPRKRAGVKPLLSHIAKGLGRVFYPPRCLACGEQVASGPGLCPPCFNEMHFFGPNQCSGCGQALDRPGQACADCHYTPMPWGRAAAVFAYAGSGKRLVLAFKHADRLDLAPHLARWLAQTGGDILANADIIAPVPLHWRRTQSRRYNQSAELVRHLPLPACSKARRMFSLLSRPEATQSQEGLSRAARRENLRGKIIATPRHAPHMKDANIVLVDDVLTTGATLSAATEACFANGAASVSVLVLARVAPNG
ncbi:double zinc ribbon domain-containing protein [Abyssibius alkaniclasticus]|uniref:double zinc ribbon domain-containing protein n=1 Tax=Abyssibius alkaniclasticus TaxID=2881234 RepID=UPI004058A0CD